MPQDFLTLALKFQDSGQEIERRCAVSRAYYAALHWAREHQELCPSIHRDTVTGGSHEAVIQRFLRHTASTLAMQIGYILRDLRNRREDADYALIGTCVASQSRESVRQAERVKTMVDELVGTQGR